MGIKIVDLDTGEEISVKEYQKREKKMKKATPVEKEEAAFKNRMKKHDAKDAAMKSPRKQKSTTRKYKGGFMGKGSGRATRGY
jgi:glutamyl-tRNA reductase